MAAVAAAVLAVALVSLAIWRPPVAAAPSSGPPRLADDPLLQVELSLVLRSQPLDEVLVKLSQAGHVTLKQREDPERRGAKVTARLKQVPLHGAMAALAGLYGAGWAREGKSYVLSGGPRGTEKSLLRLGDPDWLSFTIGHREYERRKDAARRLVAGLTPEQLSLLKVDAKIGPAEVRQRKLGLPLAAVPAATREELRRVGARAGVLSRLGKARRAAPDVVGAAVVRVTTPKASAANPKPVPRLTVTVGSLGPQTVVDMPLPPAP